MNFEKALKDLINSNSKENASNTSDCILAQYLVSCLNAFDVAVQQRETSYGREARHSFAAEAVQSKECEAVIKFKIPKEEADALYASAEILRKLGITFDTGGHLDEEGNLCYDWEFDWSLKGPAKVYFKRFKETE